MKLIQIKLPRKRKKRYIKENSRYDYKMMILANEVIFEDTQQREYTRFPRFRNEPGKKLKVLFNY